MLKHLIMETPGHSFKDLTQDKCKKVLIQAICNILKKCKDQTYRIVSLNKVPDQVETAQEATETEMRDVSKLDDAMQTSMEHLETIGSSSKADFNIPEEKGGVLLSPTNDVTSDTFHERLVLQNLETIDDVEKFYADNFSTVSNRYGVLLFLYSVLLTKGIENVLAELSDTSEPLIDKVGYHKYSKTLKLIVLILYFISFKVFGYGSQALINLMLTGRAVAHVWDNEQDVGGLKLKGIDQQSDIGFITLMEQLQFCTVGSFFKNPKNPVWVMGSETHLTVLFSNEKRLVSPETPSEIARRVFHQYDPDNSSFISSAVLQDVLCALNLVDEPEYVDLMRKKLDPDGTSIILLNDFMYEFFPEDKKSVPDTFDLQHYNGIPNSNVDGHVKFNKGTAILLETQLTNMCNQSNAMLTCLQTKWPNIEINWNESRTPSLN